MITNLTLTQNAQFYRSVTAIGPAAIQKILDGAVENSDPNTPMLLDEFRQPRKTSSTGVAYDVSARVFATRRDVHFWNQPLEDTIYAYIVILEIANHIVILKKSCANINEIVDEHLILLSMHELSASFDDEKVEFQKIAIRNMTVSDRAVRARSYEAADLKGVMSTHAAGHSIPYFFKIREGSSLKTFSGQSGRLVEASVRQNIDQISQWAEQQILLITTKKGSKDFLSSFAATAELKEVLQKTRPLALFIESAPLFRRLAELGEITFKSRKRGEIPCSPLLRSRLTSALENVFELNDKFQVVRHENRFQVKVNAKSITFSSKLLQRFKVLDGGKPITLQKLILRDGFYSVCFADPKFMYFMGKCFKDTSGVSEIPSILKLLHPIAKMTNAKSEKGSFSATKKSFDLTSVFGIVEKLHQKDDYILCDDLGVEWADHITFNMADSCICFIHSKHGPVSNSASKLHDVVGQGIKNLGNMSFSRSMLMQKCTSKFDNMYATDKIATMIPRVRQGVRANLDVYLEEMLQSYRLHRKCILACSFISKTAIETEFKKIEAGTPVKGNIIQLLWIISSFAHAAKDANAEPIIYCQP